MPRLTKQMIDFCAKAYGILKDDDSERACYIQYSQSGERYIDLIMQKKSYYFGEWVLFEGSVYVMTVDESLLKEWHDSAYSKATEIIEHIKG